MEVFNCVKSDYEYREPLYVDDDGKLVIGRYEEDSSLSLIKYNNKEYTQVVTLKNVCDSDNCTFIISIKDKRIISLREDETYFKLMEYDVESQVENLLVSFKVELGYDYENAFDTSHFIVLVFQNYDADKYMLYFISKKSYEVKTISMLCEEPQISVNEVNLNNDIGFVIQGKFTLPDNDTKNFYCTNAYMISLEDIKFNDQIDLEEFEILQSYKYKDYLMQDGLKLYFAINTGYQEQMFIELSMINQETKQSLKKQDVLLIGLNNNDYIYQEVIGQETHIRSILNKDLDICIKDIINQSVYRVTHQNIIFSNLPFRGSVIIYDYISNSVAYEKDFDEMDIPVQTRYLEQSDTLVIY